MPRLQIVYVLRMNRACSVHAPRLQLLYKFATSAALLHTPLIAISHLHYQSVLDPKLESSPTPSSPPVVRDLLELDQLVVMLLQEEGKNFSGSRIHGLLSWMAYDRDVNSWTA